MDSVKNNEQAIEFHSHKYPDGSPEYESHDRWKFIMRLSWMLEAIKI